MGGWNKEVTNVSHGWKPPPCCLVGSGLMLIMPLVLFCLMGTMSIDATGYTMTAEDHLVTAAPTTQAPFQCDRANLWSLTKQRWCCEHRGVGCSSTTWLQQLPQRRLLSSVTVPIS